MIWAFHCLQWCNAMPTPPNAKLTAVHPDPFDRDPLHRIGMELQRLLADTLTKPLTRDMVVLLHRLERVEMESARGHDRPAPGRGRAAAPVRLSAEVPLSAGPYRREAMPTSSAPWTSMMLLTPKPKSPDSIRSR